MRGASLQVVQELLGHSRINETMRYSHLSRTVKRDAVAKLAGWGQPGQGHNRGTRPVAGQKDLGIKRERLVGAAGFELARPDLANPRGSLLSRSTL